ncbi:hypothetical protein LC724_22220 [Blautia sp. RD014234]|nr:hypothetical protein [Blautia parvula]
MYHLQWQKRHFCSFGIRLLFFQSFFTFHYRTPFSIDILHLKVHAAPGGDILHPDILIPKSWQHAFHGVFSKLFDFERMVGCGCKKPLYKTPSPFASAANSIFWAARIPFVLFFARMTITVGARKKKKCLSILLRLAMGLIRSTAGFIFERV